jgi:hypothetical protein
MNWNPLRIRDHGAVVVQRSKLIHCRFWLGSDFWISEGPLGFWGVDSKGFLALKRSPNSKSKNMNGLSKSVALVGWIFLEAFPASRPT